MYSPAFHAFSQGPVFQALQRQQPPVKRKKPKTWTAEEDQKLTEAVRAHGTENWIVVAQYVGGGRTRSQCSQRWLRVINPKLSKLSWSHEEDELLLQAVQSVGTRSWTKVAAIVGHRCDVQCRYRYQQLMKKQSKYHSLPTPREMGMMNRGFSETWAAGLPIPMYVDDSSEPEKVVEPPKEKLPSIWNIIDGSQH